MEAYQLIGRIMELCESTPVTEIAVVDSDGNVRKIEDIRVGKVEGRTVIRIDIQGSDAIQCGCDDVPFEV